MSDHQEGPVSGLAGALYAELQRLVEAHGEAAVSGLVPLTVSALEWLESALGESQGREALLCEARRENEALLAQFERERARRREAEERFLELEDSLEQDRKSLVSKANSALSQFRQMEQKARTLSDTILQLEEDKKMVDREHQGLLQRHKATLRTVSDLQAQVRRQASRCPTPTVPNVDRRAEDLPVGWTDSEGDQGHPASCTSEEVITPPTEPPSLPDPRRPPPSPGPRTQSPGRVRGTSEEVEEILQSTPELHPPFEREEEPVTSTPIRGRDADPDRNTDSILEELQIVGLQYIGELDSGADISGPDAQTASVMAENAELREREAALDRARRSLIARVEELVDARTQLRQEVRRLEGFRAAQEARIGQLGAALSRAEATNRSNGQEVTETAAPHPRGAGFTRAEMSRVITERNLFKERLMELQEAVYRSHQLRILKEQNPTGKSTLWDRFHRLLGLSRRQDASSSDPGTSPQATPAMELSVWHRRESIKCSESIGRSPGHTRREERREHWLRIRTYIWEHHGRAQLQGWSLPLQDVTEGPRGAGPRSATPHCPALVQVRLLDQKDPGSELSCATSVHLSDSDLRTLRRASIPDSPEPRMKLGAHPRCSVWICSRTASGTEVTVIDPCRSNQTLASFPLAQRRALCASAVPAPPHSVDESEDPGVRSRGSEGRGSPGGGEEAKRGDGDTEALPTVWLGTRSGWLFVHSMVTPRTCLGSVQLEDAVHCIVYVRGDVVVALGNGTLNIFRRDTDGHWDTASPRSLELGCGRQPVTCAVPVSGRVWCGCRNLVFVVNPKIGKIERWFEVTPAEDAEIRHMSRVGDGVWVSVWRESCLRLFHNPSGDPLQEVDLQPLICRMFGPAPLGPDAHYVTSLLAHQQRLWIGTGGGSVISIPLSARQDPEAVPAENGVDSAPHGEGAERQPSFCRMSRAQICFHGHKDAVRFIVAVSGSVKPVGGPAGGGSREEPSTSLVMSGGEGYLNFRIGDEASEPNTSVPKSDRSHLVVSQITS